MSCIFTILFIHKLNTCLKLGATIQAHREILHAQNDQLITDRRSITAPEDPHANDAQQLESMIPCGCL